MSIVNPSESNILTITNYVISNEKYRLQHYLVWRCYTIGDVIGDVITYGSALGPIIG